MIALMLLTTGTAWAEDFPKASLKIVDIEEVVVIATPKENRKLRDLPVAATVLSQDNMRANQVNSVKNLTGIVPNLFIPDYGSKLTTSIYIRGIGSRINTPSVGLYVDNIPYIDKSAFDFNYADIERIDILRGPQGTLYGRNTMDSWEDIIVAFNSRTTPARLEIPVGKYTVVCKDGVIDVRGLGTQTGPEVIVPGQSALIMYK